MPFQPSDDPLELLKKTRAWPGLEFEADPDALIDQAMLKAADPALFPLVAAALEVDDLTLGRLRQAAAQLPTGRGPVVLLTTVPEEAHGLGLLMLECLLMARGAKTDVLAGYLGLTLVGGFFLVWAGARLADVIKPG